MNNELSTETDDELLTSYLDRELSSDDRLQLEQRLVDDSSLRQRLAEMRRAWDLLDAVFLREHLAYLHG